VELAALSHDTDFPVIGTGLEKGENLQQNANINWIEI